MQLLFPPHLLKQKSSKIRHKSYLQAFHSQIFNEDNDSKNRFADYLIFRCVLLAGINAGPWSEGERKRLVNIFVVCLEASKGGIWLPTIL